MHDIWDKYFHMICVAVSTKSPCLSRKIGTILVRDHSIISTGYNGPPRGIPHCGFDRTSSDILLSNKLLDMEDLKPDNITDTCPRRLLKFPSGKGMEWCTAQHAEVNAIINAARSGASTLNTTLYMNCVIPCKTCFGALINAGIREIVIEETKFYDVHSKFIISNSDIIIRPFQI